MVVDFVGNGLGDAISGTGTLVILNDGLAAWFLARSEGLEGGEALDAVGAAEGLVGVFVAVDGDYLGEAVEVLGGFLVGGLEVLAVAAPWGVELDNLIGGKRGAG